MENNLRLGKLRTSPIENSLNWFAVSLLAFHTADNVEPIVSLSLHVQGHQGDKASHLVGYFVLHLMINIFVLGLKTTCITKSMSNAMPA